MKIVAYKCADTGTVFEHWSDYIRHRKRVKKNADKIRKEINRVTEARQALAELRESATSSEEICRWIVDNQLPLINSVPDNQWWGREPMKDFKITKAYFKSIKFDRNIKNTHTSPIGLPTNWKGYPHLPTGYPGWRGILHMEYTGYLSIAISRLFEGTGINVFMGSSGAGKFEMHANLFSVDWPAWYTLHCLSAES